MTIFDLINNYQDCIVASVSLVLGSVQAGVSSWAINRIIADEQFLIYIIGHVMSKRTKNLKEAIENYSNLKEFLRNDLFETLDVVKIAFSIALVAGICQVLASLLMLYLRKVPSARKVWFCVAGLSIIGLIISFFLVLKFLVQNVLYFQVFLATTGVNFFVLIHLLMAMIFESSCGSKSEDESKDTEETSIKSGDSGTTFHTTIDQNEATAATDDAETQTPSIAVSIQEEFPLPLPPPIPTPNV